MLHDRSTETGSTAKESSATKERAAKKKNSAKKVSSAKKDDSVHTVSIKEDITQVDVGPSTKGSWKSVLAVEIQKKKELKALTIQVILNELEKVIISNPAILNKLRKNISLLDPKGMAQERTLVHPKSKEFKMLLKLTRERLRRTYGLFRSRDSSELDSALDLYLKKPTTAHLTSLLRLHESTKERLPIYPKLYGAIFLILTKKGLTTDKDGVHILDLACGLNPLGLSYIPVKVGKYVGYDINTKEIELLNRFFKTGIMPHSTKVHSTKVIQKEEIHCNTGEAIIGDVRSCALEEGDVAFCFKILDVIDRNSGHTRSEALLLRIPCRFVVASFATKTMSGKPMTAPKRRWMEWLCNRRKWDFEVLEYENEIFYIIDKQ